MRPTTANTAEHFGYAPSAVNPGAWDDAGEVTTGERLLHSITTPHPRREHRQDGNTNLYDTLGVDTIRAVLDEASAGDPDRFDEVRVAAAQHVAQEVNKALWFAERTPGAKGQKLLPDLKNVRENQTTNCYGYCLVASLGLEAVGVAHGFGYVNGHSVLLVPTGRGSHASAWLIDPLSPQLSQDLTKLTPSTDWQSVHKEAQQRGRGAVVLRTGDIGDCLGQSVATLSERHPWVMRGSGGYGRSDNRDQGATQRDTRLIMSVFPMREGRRALENLIGYKNAMAADDSRLALNYLRSMRGIYPELDARENHRLIARLTGNLCKLGDVPAATEAVEAYFESFASLTNDPRLATLEGDCWRIIAAYDPSATERARLCYGRAAQRTRVAQYAGQVVAPKLAALKA